LTELLGDFYEHVISLTEYMQRIDRRRDVKWICYGVEDSHGNLFSPEDIRCLCDGKSVCVPLGLLKRLFPRALLFTWRMFQSWPEAQVCFASLWMEPETPIELPAGTTL